MSRWTQKPRLLLVLLLITGALNIAFVGYHIGRCFHAKPTHEHVMNARIEGLTSLLPDRSRSGIESALNGANASVKQKYKAMNAERHHIQTLIAAPDIDKNELQAAFDNLRDLHASSQKIYQDAFVDAVVKLSPSERRHIKHKMKQRHPAAASAKTQEKAE